MGIPVGLLPTAVHPVLATKGRERDGDQVLDEVWKMGQMTLVPRASRSRSNDRKLYPVSVGRPVESDGGRAAMKVELFSPTYSRKTGGGREGRTTRKIRLRLVVAETEAQVVLGLHDR
jgi:hypothetical protein